MAEGGVVLYAFESRQPPSWWHWPCKHEHCKPCFSHKPKVSTNNYHLWGKKLCPNMTSFSSTTTGHFSEEDLFVSVVYLKTATYNVVTLFE